MPFAFPIANFNPADSASPKQPKPLRDAVPQALERPYGLG